MKYEKLIYGLDCLLVVGGAVIKVLHIPIGNLIILVGLMGTSAFQA